jgi:hypothetical protein
MNRVALALGLAATALAGPSLLDAPAHAADPLEMSKDILAVQIRKQGFDCVDPVGATPDPAASKPDENAWILECVGVKYRIKLIPDMAAQVERLPAAATGDTKATQP